MNKKIYLKVTKIFDDIFDLKKKLKKSTNTKDISNWDSINNLKLIIVLEKEFKIKYFKEFEGGAEGGTLRYGPDGYQTNLRDGLGLKFSPECPLEE